MRRRPDGRVVDVADDAGFPYGRLDEQALSFFDDLEAKLEERGFFRPQHKRPVMPTAIGPDRWPLASAKARPRAERLAFGEAKARPLGMMSRNLCNILHRMELTEQDVRTSRGMIVWLVEGPREPQTTKRKGPKQTPKGTRPDDG